MGWGPCGTAEGTSPTPTGNGMALVCLETPSRPGVAIAVHKEHGRTSSAQCSAAHKSPATSLVLPSPLLPTIPTPTAICSPFLMCSVAAPPARARSMDFYIRAVQGAGNPPSPADSDTGTGTPSFALCLSHCIPFPLGEFSISDELFTNYNYGNQEEHTQAHCT